MSYALLEISEVLADFLLLSVNSGEISVGSSTVIGDYLFKSKILS